MRWINILAVLCTASCSFMTMAASLEREVLASYRLNVEQNREVMNVATEFEIVRREGNHFVIYVPANKMALFSKLAPSAQIIEKDIHKRVRELLSLKSTYMSGYRSFDQISEYLSYVSRVYSDIAKLETYGQSRYGRPLYALKVSDNVMEDEDEPELLLTAATHGDELITPEVLLGLLEELLTSYGEDERLTKIIDSNQLYFVPVVNPDGFSQQSRYAHGIDPNRDYPWPENQDRDPVECVAQGISFFKDHNFVGSMDFHASGQMVMYPWAYTYQSPVATDDAVFSELVDYMAEENGYIAGQISKVIYVAKGSSADYYYWQNGTLALGIELARTKVPPSSQIPVVIDEAREMTWRFIESFN